MKIMQEEIFAPILPIMNYEDISEAVDYITERDKPLALYVFSHNQELIDYVLQHTTSGNASVNDVVVHFTDVNLPFGGVNTSGIGSYHGVYGFKEFSHEKAYLFKPLIKRIRARGFFIILPRMRAVSYKYRHKACRLQPEPGRK